MEITKYQMVVFTELNGTERKCGNLEVNWSSRKNAFYIFSNIDEDEKLYSTTIIEKPKSNKKYTKQTDITKMVEIFPCGESEKAYQLYDGSNNKVTNFKQYYKYVAKSVCMVENGRIYSPRWAL